MANGRVFISITGEKRVLSVYDRFILRFAAAIRQWNLETAN